MAICWERLSRQLFTVLILNAVLDVLVPPPFGVFGRDVEHDCIGSRSLPFCLPFTVNPSSGPVAGVSKVVRPWDTESVPRVPKARDGESTRGGFPTLVRGVRGMSPEKMLGSERL